LFTHRNKENEMKERIYYRTIIWLLVLVLIVVGCARRGPQVRVPPTETPCPQETAPPPREELKINGSLEEVNGMRVLRLWGSHQEMGYAYGYLLADELVEVIEQSLFDGMLSNLPRSWTYEQVAQVVEQKILWPEGYREEMEAMVRGMETALGALPEITHQRIERGSAVVEPTMLAVINASQDVVDLSLDCCGFAAWGEATGDGQTRIGGNEQGPWNEMSEHTLLMVRKPDYGLSWACSNVVGSLSCMRGMNETGVAVTPQGAETPWLEVKGPCYAGMHARLGLEQVAAGPNMVSRVAEVIEEYPRCGSTFWLFAQGSPTWSDPNPDQMAVVIEQDNTGVTARLPSHNALHGNPLTEAIVVTNHILQREVPASYQASQESIHRYEAMVAVLQERVMADVTDIQEVLTACDPGGIGKQSVYMEPDSMMIHVAFRPSTDAPSSPHHAPTSFTWEELFAPIRD
jgi:hypothetical protein